MLEERKVGCDIRVLMGGKQVTIHIYLIYTLNITTQRLPFTKHVNLLQWRGELHNRLTLDNNTVFCPKIP
jgi:hypothetical protein